MNGLPDKERLRTDEVAEYYRVTVATVWRWIHEGKIRAKRVEGRILIPRAEAIKLEKWIE